MKKIVCLLVLAMLSLYAAAFAEELPGLPDLAQDGGRITGSMDIGRGYALQVEMPVPQAIAGLVKQYKMQRIQITGPQISALLDGRTQPVLPDEGCEIWTLDRTEFRQFIYQEETLKYAAFFVSDAPFPLAGEAPNPALDLANRQAQSLLEDWGVPYAYPFYQVCNAARSADVSLRDTPLRTGSEVKEYLRSNENQAAQSEYDYYGNERKLFDEEYVIVRVRQQVDDIPFAIADIRSPYYRPDNPQYDEGVYLLLQYNSKGEIVYADACNLHTVAAESGEPLSVLGWQECLAALPQDNPFFDGLLEAKVIGAELCYAIDGKHQTYPVWQFIVEFKQSADSTLQQYLCFAKYVDACSGKPL